MDGRLKDEALQFQIRVLSVFPDFNTLVISDIGIFGLRWLGVDSLSTEESPRPQCSRKRAQIKKGTHSMLVVLATSFDVALCSRTQ